VYYIMINVVNSETKLYFDIMCDSIKIKMIIRIYRRVFKLILLIHYVLSRTDDGDFLGTRQNSIYKYIMIFCPKRKTIEGYRSCTTSDNGMH